MMTLYHLKFTDQLRWLAHVDGEARCLRIQAGVVLFTHTADPVRYATRANDAHTKRNMRKTPVQSDDRMIVAVPFGTRAVDTWSNAILAGEEPICQRVETKTLQVFQ